MNCFPLHHPVCNIGASLPSLDVMQTFEANWLTGSPSTTILHICWDVRYQELTTLGHVSYTMIGLDNTSSACLYWHLQPWFPAGNLSWRSQNNWWLPTDIKLIGTSVKQWHAVKSCGLVAVRLRLWLSDRVSIHQAPDWLHAATLASSTRTVEQQVSLTWTCCLRFWGWDIIIARHQSAQVSQNLFPEDPSLPDTHLHTFDGWQAAHDQWCRGTSMVKDCHAPRHAWANFPSCSHYGIDDPTFYWIISPA